MAHFPFIDGKCTVNAVDLSAHVEGIDAEFEVRTAEDGPTMGQTVVKEFPIIKKGNIRVRFKQDFASAQVHATLLPLLNNKTAHSVNLRPTSGAIAATNPEFVSAGAYLVRYAPIAGNFGDVMGFEAVWANVDMVEDTIP